MTIPLPAIQSVTLTNRTDLDQMGMWGPGGGSGGGGESGVRWGGGGSVCHKASSRQQKYAE